MLVRLQACPLIEFVKLLQILLPLYQKLDSMLLDQLGCAT